MSEWIDAAAAAAGRCAAPAIGVLIGTAARYGEALKQGKPLTWVGFLGDILLLGILVVFAVGLSKVLGVEGDLRTGVGALTGVSADRLIRLARDRFEKRATAALDELAGG